MFPRGFCFKKIEKNIALYPQEQESMKQDKLSINIFLYNWIFLIIVFCFVSCNEKKEGDQSNESLIENKTNVRSKPASSYSDTLFIDIPAAVFYFPDSLQLEKIKALTDSTIFESQLHEFFYQMKYSKNALQKNRPKIKTFEARNFRFVLFHHKNDSTECIDLNSLNDFCGVLLFDGNKKAKLADMTNIDSELGFYFLK